MISRSATISHFPVLSTYDFGFFRSHGPGLGNLLFPISRALVGSDKYGGTFVYPTVPQIKLGPFLRRERDKRIYGNLFRSRNMTEWSDWIRAKRNSWITEEHNDVIQTRATICYSGLKRYFYDIEGHEQLISDWIGANAQFSGEILAPYDIGIHIRLGDFVAMETSSTGSNMRIPMEWYRQAFKEATSILGLSTPKVLLFTDGDIDQVRQALGIGMVRADPSNNAVTAIMNLSKAKLIITSRSTFSMWSAYLGSVPAIWDKRFELGEYFPLREKLDISI